MKTLPPIALVILKIVVGLALLGLVLSRVPLKDAFNALAALSPVAVAGAVGLYFTAHFINALKLRVLMPDLSIRQSWRFTMIAVLYGTVLPGQLAGDAVKAFRLTRAASRSGDVSVTIGAVTVDKAVGLFALLILTALGLGVDASTFGPEAVRYVGAGLALFVLMLVVLVGAPMPPFLERWVAQFSAWRRITLRPATLLLSLAYGLVFQCISIAVFAVLGFDLGLTLSAAAWAVTVGLVSIILLLPVTVAGLGLRDGSLVAVIAVLGQDESAALALSLIILALNLVGAGAGYVLDVLGSDQDD